AVAFRREVPEAQLAREPELDRRRVPADLARDELESAARRVGDHQAPHASAEGAARGLDVECPFIVRNVRGYHSAHLSWVLAQMPALGPDGHRRIHLQLVVGLGPAMLHIHGRRLTVDVVHPAETLREHRAVRLDRLAVALHKAVARVVAAQEGILRLGVRVEDHRRDLLVTRARVELFAEPGNRTFPAGEIDVLYLCLVAPPGSAGPLSRAAEKTLRPQTRDMRAQQRVVVRETNRATIATHVSIRHEKA